jgi:CDP-diacylglycerol--serine O-phosphatidyltransferase
MKKHFPNFLTCCNLLCGSLGILSILSTGTGNTEFMRGIEPAYFVWASCIFDFFDGFAARWLKVSSPIGKELDSLAEVISFGLLPAFFMFKYIEKGISMSNEDSLTYLPYVCVLIVVCSALRLAIFNVDETQQDSFKGLPTPANALFITGLPFLSPLFSFVGNYWGLTIITLVFSLLLVSRFELFALKFKNFKWADNQLRFTFLLLTVLLLAVFQFAALPMIILLYILLSLGAQVFAKQK